MRAVKTAMPTRPARSPGSHRPGGTSSGATLPSTRDPATRSKMKELWAHLPPRRAHCGSADPGPQRGGASRWEAAVDPGTFRSRLATRAWARRTGGCHLDIRLPAAPAPSRRPPRTVPSRTGRRHRPGAGPPAGGGGLDVGSSAAIVAAAAGLAVRSRSLPVAGCLLIAQLVAGLVQFPSTTAEHLASILVGGLATIALRRPSSANGCGPAG
jgi:hypothetical protein